MAKLTRRAVLRSSLGAAAAGVLARPYIANAAATTATIWWVQGFAHEEDISFEKIVADYQKLSGNTIEHSIIPYAPIRQKIIAALTSGGEVPDVFQNTPTEMLALHAWEGRLFDVSDVVETQKAKLTEAMLQFCNCYNRDEKNSTWRALRDRPASSTTSGDRSSKRPATRCTSRRRGMPGRDFFKGVQRNCAPKACARSTAVTLSTVGNDSNNQFNCALIAYGGRDHVTPDGKLHLDDPKVKDAVVKALTYTTTAYKDGNVPSGAVNWNDSDNNNAFHSKQIVMDIDGTISTEVAIIANQQDYNDIVTEGMALGNDGQPIPSSVTGNCGMIPKGAKNVAVAKDFLKYLIQPEISNEYLKVGLGGTSRR